VLVIENYRSGFLLAIEAELPYIVRGLWLAGFAGGWL
jgi:hypothetical protein